MMRSSLLAQARVRLLGREALVELNPADADYAAGGGLPQGFWSPAACSSPAEANARLCEVRLGPAHVAKHDTRLPGSLRWAAHFHESKRFSSGAVAAPASWQQFERDPSKRPQQDSFEAAQHSAQGIGTGKCSRASRHRACGSEGCRPSVMTFDAEASHP